jgi:hypothetical protein
MNGDGVKAIAANTHRFRQHSRQTAGVTAHDPINENWIVRVGGGSETLFVDQAAVTPEVPAGGIVDVTLEVVNAALVLGPGDDDHCSEGGNAGYNYRVIVDPSWTTEQTTTNCVTLSEDRASHQFDFEAPDTAGVETVDITVEGVGSGFSGGGSFEVAVTDSDGGDDGGGDPIRPGPGDGRDGDDGGSSPPFLPGDGQLIGTPAAIGIGGGLALLLVVLIATR